MSGCIGHQSTHTCKLFDLFIRSTGTRVSHHEDVVVLIKSGKKCMSKLIVSLLPGIHNLFITLFLSNKTTFIVLCDLIYSILCSLDHLRLLRRHGHIRNRYSHGSSCRILVTHSFDRVQNLSSLGCSVSINNFFKDLFQLFLTNQEVNLKKKFISRNASVNKSKILRQDLIEQETSQCRLYIACESTSIRHYLAAADKNLGLQSNYLVLICQNCLVYTLEELAFSLVSRSFLCQIVNTKNHIL